MWIMNEILAVSIAVSSMVMMLFQFVRNFRNKGKNSLRSRLLPWVLFATVLAVVINVVCAGTLSAFSLLCDVSLGVCPLMLLSSTVWNGENVLKALAVYWILCSFLVAQYIISAIGLIPVPSPCIYMLMVLLSLLMMTVLVLYGIWRFLYNVKLVLRSGTVWNSVCLSVETVYLLMVSFLISASACAAFAVGGAETVYVYIPLVLLWLALMALSFRINSETTLIFCHKMERRILESLKVAAVEVPNDVTRTDTAYQEIYDRIVAYFETEKPYLRHDLAIDDLVKVVFSNKLYISRSISQITGRNFCQFVNYYRVMYSVEQFRVNPELKVTELANLSGFNSLVSFSMAFRLYMNENPSDWIRKERSRRIKSGLR